MRAPSFRLKLLAAMMLVVGFVTSATLWATQRTLRSAVERDLGERFQAETRHFFALREARLAAVKQQCLDLARSVRLLAAIRESDPELLYQTGWNELEIRRVRPPSFLRLLDAAGRVVRPTDPRAGLLEAEGRPAWERQMGAASRVMAGMGEEPQAILYLAVETSAGRTTLEEVVLTRVLDRGRVLGALVLGFPIPDLDDAAPVRAAALPSGIWLDGDLHSRTIAAELRAPLGEALGRVVASGADADLRIGGGDEPYRVFARSLVTAPNAPSAYQVGLFPLADAVRQERRLRLEILGLGAAALVAALALSLVLSRGLTVPIRELVRGTTEVRHGNYAVQVPVRSRDEVGELAESFNEMAEGLAAGKRIRNLLDVVTDREVAEQLLRGEVALGGEIRDVSVVFCDIRGFTALTQDMPPAEMIELLNEHMTELTRVVYEHHGVVDKFVGDLIMAVFGAPKSYGDDAENAVACAVEMIERRKRLNEVSRYRISVGIGVATGPVVAGCMGSADRLNYTVLGERVNLASRLCGRAGPMEVVIDEATHGRLDGRIRDEALGSLRLKGFDTPVAAYRLTEAPSGAPA